jgi:phage N-6-adenine-methyltransferase
MTLVGFKARNHPQQTADANVDDRAITLEDFAAIDARFHFTIDVAATPRNARLPQFFSPADDALARDWPGRVWCNPPYSNINAWVEKAWVEHWRGTPLIVMLLPANRTEQKWWQTNVEPYREAVSGFRTEFLPGRMRFLRNGATDIKPNERPPFGCCLLIWEARA